MNEKKTKPLLFGLFSAILFGLSAPLSKLLLNEIEPMVLAGLLYLGAFLGLGSYSLIKRLLKRSVVSGDSLGKTDLPYLVGAVIFGGIIGPILLMMGLSLVSGFVVSLLLNMEVVATVFIAFFVFKENSGVRLWAALIAITLGGILLTFNPVMGNLHIIGPIMILIAMVSWGIDNNLTRKISDKNPIQITIIKGFVGGSTSLGIAVLLGARISLSPYLIFGLILGTFSVGLSLIFFIKSLQDLGSSRTGMIFSLAPFIGAGVSILLLREQLNWVMLPATLLMIIGVLLFLREDHLHQHQHEIITHTHPHRHEGLHHRHLHQNSFLGRHNHSHTHKPILHSHFHWPDIHHRHGH